jgi:hypothetical protein
VRSLPAASADRLEDHLLICDTCLDMLLSSECFLAAVRRYAMFTPYSPRQVYSNAWERCKLERNGRPRRAEQIQVLVTAWKALRKGSGKA